MADFHWLFVWVSRRHASMQPAKGNNQCMSAVACTFHLPTCKHCTSMLHACTSSRCMYRYRTMYTLTRPCKIFVTSMFSLPSEIVTNDWKGWSSIPTIYATAEENSPRHPPTFELIILAGLLQDLVARSVPRCKTCSCCGEQLHILTSFNFQKIAGISKTLKVLCSKFCSSSEPTRKNRFILGRVMLSEVSTKREMLLLWMKRKSLNHSSYPGDGSIFNINMISQSSCISFPCHSYSVSIKSFLDQIAFQRNSIRDQQMSILPPIDLGLHLQHQ